MAADRKLDPINKLPKVIFDSFFDFLEVDDVSNFKRSCSLFNTKTSYQMLCQRKYGFEPKQETARDIYRGLTWLTGARVPIEQKETDQVRRTLTQLLNDKNSFANQKIPMICFFYLSQLYIENYHRASFDDIEEKQLLDANKNYSSLLIGDQIKLQDELLPQMKFQLLMTSFDCCFQLLTHPEIIGKKEIVLKGCRQLLRIKDLAAVENFLTDETRRNKLVSQLKSLTQLSSKTIQGYSHAFLGFILVHVAEVTFGLKGVERVKIKSDEIFHHLDAADGIAEAHNVKAGSVRFKFSNEQTFDAVNFVWSNLRKAADLGCTKSSAVLCFLLQPRHFPMLDINPQALESAIHNFYKYYEGFDKLLSTKLDTISLQEMINYLKIASKEFSIFAHILCFHYLKQEQNTLAVTYLEDFVDLTPKDTKTLTSLTKLFRDSGTMILTEEGFLLKSDNGDAKSSVINLPFFVAADKVKFEKYFNRFFRFVLTNSLDSALLLDLSISYCIPQGCSTPHPQKAKLYLRITAEFLVSQIDHYKRGQQHEKAQPYLESLNTVVDIFINGRGIFNGDAELAKKFSAYLKPAIEASIPPLLDAEGRQHTLTK